MLAEAKAKAQAEGQGEDSAEKKAQESRQWPGRYHCRKAAPFTPAL